MPNRKRSGCRAISCARGARHPPQFGQARAGVGDHVRIGVQHPAHPREVLGRAQDVRPDPRDVGASGDRGTRAPPSAGRTSGTVRGHRTTNRGAARAPRAARSARRAVRRTRSGRRCGSSPARRPRRPRPTRDRAEGRRGTPARPRGRAGAGPGPSRPSARGRRPRTTRGSARRARPTRPAANSARSHWANVANRPGCARSYRSRFASSSSPHIPSRLTTASTPHASISASSAPTSGAAHDPVSQRPRWLWASTSGAGGRAGRSVSGRRTAARGRYERSGRSSTRLDHLDRRGRPRGGRGARGRSRCDR